MKEQNTTKRIPKENRQLTLYTQLLEQNQNLANHDFVMSLVAEHDAAIAFIDQQLSEAARFSNSQLAIDKL